MSKRAAAKDQSDSVSPGIPAVFDDTLGEGVVVVPKRPIGMVGPELPVQFPTKWPKAIQDVMDRRGDKPIRLFADGIFDLFHYGHARALEQAKKSFPNVTLLVGCNNDELTHKYKGQTVMMESERYESLRHCRWVDEVIPDSPWVLTDEFLIKHDIDFVCHDALPYVDVSNLSGTGDVYSHLKAMGKFHETQRTEGVSTSDLIIRIVKSYDDFVKRNMARGFSAKEMNVPFLKEKSIQLEMILSKQTAAAAQGIHKLSDAAESFHYDFLRMFSRQGPVVHSLVEGWHRLTGSKKEEESSMNDGNSSVTSPVSGCRRARDVEVASAGEPPSAKRNRSGSS